MLARLGLRAGEIVALQLDDIDWANAELAIRSKKGDGWARLPLMVDVGQALARILGGAAAKRIPKCLCSGYAPYTPFVFSVAVSDLVRKAIKKSRSKIGPERRACVPAHPRH